MNNECKVCGKAAELICSGCRRVHYCSRTCQRANWSDHKPSCRGSIGNLWQPDEAYLAWRSDDERGRHVVAVRDIPPHTLLMHEEPIAVQEIFGPGPGIEEWSKFFPEGTDVGKHLLVGDEGPVLAKKMEQVGWTDASARIHFAATDPDDVENNSSQSYLERVVDANSFQPECAMTMVVYAGAMYYKASSFNHACYPNAYVRFGLRGNIYVASGTRTIRAGDEVTVSYMKMPFSAEMCTSARQRLVPPRIKCFCSACAMHTPCAGDCTCVPTQHVVNTVLAVGKFTSGSLFMDNAGHVEHIRGMIGVWNSRHKNGIRGDCDILYPFAWKLAVHAVLARNFDIFRSNETFMDVAEALEEHLKQVDVNGHTIMVVPGLLRVMADIVRENCGVPMSVHADFLKATHMYGWYEKTCASMPWANENAIGDFAAVARYVTPNLSVVLEYARVIGRLNGKETESLQGLLLSRFARDYAVSIAHKKP